MFRHLIIPSIRLPPREKRLVETAKFARRFGFPCITQMAVIQYNDHTAGLRGLLHATHRLFRARDPLQDSPTRHNIEFRRVWRLNLSRRRIRTSGWQFRRARAPVRHFITVNPHHAATRANGFRNPRCDGPCAATDIEHRHPWLQNRGQATVVLLQGSATQRPWVGTV